MTKGAPHKNEIVHRTKLFGGISTAEEIHAKYGWRNAKCLLCKNKPVIQVRMFMSLKDVVESAPDFAAAIAASNPDGPFIPTVPMTFGPMVRFSTVHACRHHQKECEQQAAKAPSNVLVEIDRGPGADKPMVQVA